MLNCLFIYQKGGQNGFSYQRQTKEFNNLIQYSKEGEHF